MTTVAIAAVAVAGGWLAWRQDWTGLRAQLGTTAPQPFVSASPSEMAATAPVETPTARLPRPELIAMPTPAPVHSDPPARASLPPPSVVPMPSPAVAAASTQNTNDEESPIGPSLEDARLERAEELFAKGRFGAAIAEAKAVLSREPGNTRAQELIEDADVELVVESRLKEARAAMERGDSDAALESVRAGLAAKPTDSRLMALWKQLTQE